MVNFKTFSNQDSLELSMAIVFWGLKIKDCFILWKPLMVCCSVRLRTMNTMNSEGKRVEQRQGEINRDAGLSEDIQQQFSKLCSNRKVNPTGLGQGSFYFSICLSIYHLSSYHLSVCISTHLVVHNDEALSLEKNIQWLKRKELRK
jgi:hypothetical protein